MMEVHDVQVHLETKRSFVPVDAAAAVVVVVVRRSFSLACNFLCVCVMGHRCLDMKRSKGEKEPKKQVGPFPKWKCPFRSPAERFRSSPFFAGEFVIPTMMRA